MIIFEAIILGIIQGATEFLPISSSGHLFVLPAIFGWEEPSLQVVSIAHVGTLLAVLIYFRQDLWEVAVGVLDGLRSREPFKTKEARLGWYIVVGTIPAGIAGLTLETYLDETLGQANIAAAFLLVTALFLVIGERLLSGEKEIAGMTWTDAIIIGLFQMFALIPGISRSGSTITAGLWRGLNRALAARYSFLLGVPAILGAGLLAILDLLEASDLAQQLPALIAVFLAAAITGYACIYGLLAWLRQRSLYPFAIYCFLLGTIYLIFLA